MTPSLVTLISLELNCASVSKFLNTVALDLNTSLPNQDVTLLIPFQVTFPLS